MKVCKNCGSEIPEGSVFCETCGARVPKDEREAADGKGIAEAVQDQAEEEQQPVEEQQPAESQASPSPEYTDTPAEAESEPTILPDGMVGEKKKRSLRIKGKRWPVIAILAFIVLLVAGSTALAFPYIKHAVLRTVLPADQYFAYVIKENAEDISEQVGSIVGSAKESYSDGTTHSEISLEVGDKLKDILNMVSMMAGDDLSGETDWFRNITVDMTQVRKGFGSSISWDAHMNGTDILSVGMTYDPERETTYWSLPEINPETLGIDAGVEGGMVMQQSTALIQAMPDPDAAKRMLTEYIKTIVLNIDRVEKTKEPLTANGETEKYCCLTATLDGKTMNQIEIAVLEQAKTDAELEGMIRRFAQSMSHDEEDAYREFQASADQALEDLRSQTPRDDDGVILKLWVDGKGEIVGIRLKPRRTDEYVQWAKIRHYKKASAEFCYVSHDEKMLSLAGNSKDHGGWFWTWDGARRESDYALSVNGTEYLYVRTQDVSVGWLESGRFQGKMTIQPSKSAWSDMGIPAVASSMLQDIALVYDAPSVDNRDARSSLALCKGDGVLVKLSASSKITDGGTPDMPTDAVSGDDPEALLGWLNGCDFDGVIQNLRKAGAPTWLTGLVEDEINRWKNDLFYSEESVEEPLNEEENTEEGLEATLFDETA